MQAFKNNVPFDPGYSKYLLIFAQNYLEGMEDIQKTINNNQKKFKFRLYVSKFDKALKSTLGFWVGCILWATYIKFKYPNESYKAIKLLNNQNFNGSNIIVKQFIPIDERINPNNLFSLAAIG